MIGGAQEARAARAPHGLPALVPEVRRPSADSDEAEQLRRSLTVFVAVEAAAPGALRSASVRAAIEQLPESQRVVLHLHRYEGMTFEQIATVLAATPGGVRARAWRAYDRLRAILRPLMEAQAKDVVP